jgi:L-fuconolactonase
VTPVIDAHQHFWFLDRPWFGWPTPDLPQIYRDFGPADLRPYLLAGGVDETILVQVATDIAETAHLLALAECASFVAGVVGWVDLERPDVVDTLEGLAAKGKFIGIRPMIQSLPDAQWMLRPALVPGLAAVRDLGLTFDALVRPHHLPTLCAFVDRYPDLPVVLDHGAKPDIGKGREGYEGWAEGIAALARRPQVFCKLSGLLTEAGARASREDLAPFIDHLLEKFEPHRLRWGSDWPVVETVAPYGTWLGMARAHLARLSDDERGLIFGGVATQFYGLRRRRKAGVPL